MRDSNKKIVNERIKILFEEAEKNSDYSNRYVYLARKLSMRYNVKIPKVVFMKIDEVVKINLNYNYELQN